ncbi:MAG: HAD-IA family hydrolase [Woeseiaceae bacterium]|nr:HAD-IA family hydrolase [Woeseiaceae bacterium]
MRPQTRAIIFGGIGTLVETSELQREAFNKTFDEAKLGWHWSEAVYQQLLTLSGGRRRLRAYAQQIGAAIPVQHVEALHARKSEIFRQLLTDTPLMPRPGVQHLLNKARASDIRLAVATTTAKANVLGLADAVNLDMSAFEVVMHRALVESPKPDPEVYRRCIEALGVAADDAVAIEDSQSGVAAAIAAGVTVIAVPGANTQFQDYSAAAAVVDMENPLSLDHRLTLDLCESVLAGSPWRRAVSALG